MRWHARVPAAEHSSSLSTALHGFDLTQSDHPGSWAAGGEWLLGAEEVTRERHSVQHSGSGIDRARSAWQRRPQPGSRGGGLFPKTCRQPGTARSNSRKPAVSVALGRAAAVVGLPIIECVPTQPPAGAVLSLLELRRAGTHDL
jgi:hypothetical protein